MTSALKWLLRIGTACVGFAAAALAGAYFLLARSLPDYSATHEVTGIYGPVEIVRDRYAIPHIFGGTDEDVFFGLGFVHAQDRLWQMTLLRRAAYGRLSELFGPDLLPADRRMRILDLHGLSVRALGAQDADTQAALRAYSRGVNAWLGVLEDSVLNSGAPEFLIFDDNVRPWEPFDSIAILNLQAVNLSGHAEREALRARAAARGIGTRLNDLMPSEPGGGLALPFTEAAAGAGPEGGPRFSRPALFTPAGGSGASNAWAAGPGRTSGGAPLMANDPHLGFSAPSVWMLARLELSGGGVIGGTIPGAPLVPVGRSADLAWGVTSSYVDDQDVFLEKFSPESEMRYLTPQGSAEFRRRIDVIRIKGRPPQRIELKWTENGPVVPKEHYALNDLLPRDHFVSLGWTLLDSPNTSMTAGLRLMKARNVDEALDTVRLHRSPQLNLLIADRSEIAMQVIGAVPRRSPFHETKGTMPAPGWKLRNQWQGELPFDSLPRFRNPRNGFLGNTNNKTVDRPFPDHLSSYWGDTFRFKRLQELLGGRDIHTTESFADIQLDSQSYAAKVLVPEFARNLWHTSETVAQDDLVRTRNSALKLLFDWDGEMRENRPEPLIYAAWARAVQRQMIQDDLGSLAGEFSRPDPKFLERAFQDVDGAGAWCDIMQTEKTESCDDIALLGLDEALSRLRERYGNDIGSWRWGDAHQARHDHPVLGDRALFSWLFSIRQPVPGGDHTLNKGQMPGRGDNPYHSLLGAGYRGIYDFSDLDASRFIISTGQSGHPLSRHFDDQSTLWRAGEYAVMSLDPARARANAVGITTLEPAARP